jgi:hypothetical protein
MDTGKILVLALLVVMSVLICLTIWYKLDLKHRTWPYFDLYPFYSKVELREMEARAIVRAARREKARAAWQQQAEKTALKPASLWEWSNGEEKRPRSRNRKSGAGKPKSF